MEDAEERHRRLASRLIRKVNEVETWCIRKNEENLLRQRERILASAGMQYEDYFDEDGRPRAVTFAYEKVKGSVAVLGAVRYQKQSKDHQRGREKKREGLQAGVPSEAY